MKRACPSSEGLWVVHAAPVELERRERLAVLPVSLCREIDTIASEHVEDHERLRHRRVPFRTRRRTSGKYGSPWLGARQHLLGQPQAENLAATHAENRVPCSVDTSNRRRRSEWRLKSSESDADTQ